MAVDGATIRDFWYGDGQENTAEVDGLMQCPVWLRA